MYLIITLVSFVIAFIFMQVQIQKSPPPYLGDAANYASIAKDFSAGIKIGVRTYGYPLYLRPLASILRHLHSTLMLIGFPVLLYQFFLFSLTTIFFARAASSNKNMQLFLYAALMLNFLFLPYLSLTLTEALSIPLLLFTSALYLRLEAAWFRVLLLALFSGFLVEVRPANIWVLTAVTILMIMWLCEQALTYRKKIYYFCLFLIGVLIPLLPQIYFNWHYFQMFTLLPATPVGNHVFSEGVLFLRSSATFFYGPHQNTLIHSVYTHNPFLLLYGHFEWLSLAGIVYAFLKFLDLFLFNELFPYVWMSDRFNNVIILFTGLIAYFGVLGFYYQRKALGVFKLRALLMGWVGWLLITLPTALENRYSLPFFMLLLPFALYQCRAVWMTRSYKLLLGFIPFVLSLYVLQIFVLVSSNGIW
jgi:hypothetical protein